MDNVCAIVKATSCCNLRCEYCYYLPFADIISEIVNFLVHSGYGYH